MLQTNNFELPQTTETRADSKYKNYVIQILKRHHRACL